MALRYQQGPRSQAAAEPSKAAGASDSSADGGCSRVIDHDVALSSSSGPDVTMMLNNRTDHSVLHASLPLNTNLDSGD